MTEEDKSVYEEAQRQSISLHVVVERIEGIMELHDPDDPEISDMKYVYQELTNFKERLLMMIGENADVMWSIDQNEKQKGDG